MLWLGFGLGRHLAWVIQDDPKNIERFFKTIVANEMFYTTALACARLSLVAFFYQIFGVSSMRYFLHGFVFLIVSWAISTVRAFARCTQYSIRTANTRTSTFRPSVHAGPYTHFGTVHSRIASTFLSSMSESPSVELSLTLA